MTSDRRRLSAANVGLSITSDNGRIVILTMIVSLRTLNGPKRTSIDPVLSDTFICSFWRPKEEKFRFSMK